MPQWTSPPSWRAKAGHRLKTSTPPTKNTVRRASPPGMTHFATPPSKYLITNMSKAKTKWEVESTHVSSIFLLGSFQTDNIITHFFTKKNYYALWSIFHSFPIVFVFVRSEIKVKRNCSLMTAHFWDIGMSVWTTGPFELGQIN